jgi:hypothetical protein
MTYKLPRSLYRKGAAGFGRDDESESFLNGNTKDDPRVQSASGASYNAHDRYDDDTGYRRGAQSQGDDDASFLRPSWTGERDDAHERLSGLIDGQVDQPSGPMLTGGGPVSSNKRGGVGDGTPRYRPKTGPRTNDGF